MRRDDVVRIVETRPTWTEAWRHECECRFLLSLPDHKRRLMIDGLPPDEFGRRPMPGIRGMRGDAAVDRINRTLNALMDEAAAAKASGQRSLL